MNLTTRYFQRLLTLLVFFVSACNSAPLPSDQTIELQTPHLETLVTFRILLPTPLSAGESVSLAILDEVTGLAFNQQSHTMQAEDQLHYALTLAVPVGSVLKYRYLRQGAYTVQEYQANGLPVRYRMHHVTGQAVVEDIIARWTDTAYTLATGRILGKIIDQDSGEPIPDLMAAAGGIQTITSANGDYLIEGLSPGTHNLVIYAKDGSYRTFEQGALVQPEATTPADISLVAAPLVNITFVVSLPEQTPITAPLRLAGNLYQLGNTFSDLSGGVSSLAARMPVLNILKDGKRTISLNLPAGADLIYKYTLGDGIWNSEHTADGFIRLRHLIIPATSLTIEDDVHSWAANGPAPVTFVVNAPQITPSSDRVSIQFNPGFDWMEPLPMEFNEASHWTFTLFSPLEGLDTLQYRYCRNEQCNSADELAFAGSLSTGRSIILLDTPQTQVDDIQEWQWLPTQAIPATVPNLTIQPRPPGFIAGVSFLPDYHPSWMPHILQAVRYVQQMNANWLILSPSWTFDHSPLPLLTPDAQHDFTWHDLISTTQQARQAGLNIGYYPNVRFPDDVNAWWQDAERDYPWWVAWFAQYRIFALHSARVAANNGAGVLILGGQDLLPAVPGDAARAQSSNLPLDAGTWWHALFQEIHALYSGPVAWALPFPEGLQSPPPFLADVDFVFLEWAAPIAQSKDTDEAQMYINASALLDQIVLPFQQQSGKAVVIALAYPSADGAAAGCLSSLGENCLDYRLLGRPHLDIPQISTDLDEQGAAYNAMLLAINDRPWIGGIVSQGFYPPAILQDKSASIYGKPAAGILWYWYARFLGK